jgi:hypothetical protein
LEARTIQDRLLSEEVEWNGSDYPLASALTLLTSPTLCLSYFLGVEAHYTANGLFLSQRKYISDLLHRLNMADAKAVSTPLLLLLKCLNYQMARHRLIQNYTVKLLGPYNISLWLVLTSPLPSTSSLSSCIAHPHFIGVL